MFLKSNESHRRKNIKFRIENVKKHVFYEFNKKHKNIENNGLFTWQI